MSAIVSLWRDTWGWAGLIAAAVTALAVARLIAEDRRLARKRRENAARQAVGHDTIAMLCLCCNGARGGDCICTEDCGNPRCQAADPEEAHHA